MRFRILIFCSILFIACTNNSKVPGNVLQPKKMQAVMWDMMRADVLLSDYVFIKDTLLNRLNESQKLYQQIFGFHNITKEEFKQSFDYYQSHPKLMKALMDSLSKPVNIAPTDTVKPLPIENDTIRTVSPAAGKPMPDSAIRPGAIKSIPVN